MMMMSKEEIVAQAVSEVKLLLTQYNQSTVSFITAWTPSALSRLANNKTKIYEDIPIAAELDFFKPHVKMINELQKVTGVPGMGRLTQRDAQYMRILKKAGVELSAVKEYYADIPPGDVRNMWNSCQRYDLTTFNFNLLKMEQKDIQILKGLFNL